MLPLAFRAETVSTGRKMIFETILDFSQSEQSLFLWEACKGQYVSSLSPLWAKMKSRREKNFLAHYCGKPGHPF